MKVLFPQTSLSLLAVILGVFLLSCTGPRDGPDTELQFEGTVQYRELEGGAWVIESTEGTTYEPKDLPENYKKDGLPVRVWARRLEDQASIRMVGPIISIERIERRQ